MKLLEYIHQDNIIYHRLFSKENILDWLMCSEQFNIRRYLIALRKEEYYTFIKSNKFLKYYWMRKKNILGVKLGFFIHAGNFDLGLKIEHYGSIIIHPDARIGKNCTLHGNCCIGSKGSNSTYAPKLGDYVDIGQGAQILGDITITNHIKIGAGAIVTKSILKDGLTVVGVPAREI